MMWKWVGKTFFVSKRDISNQKCATISRFRISKTIFCSTKKSHVMFLLLKQVKSTQKNILVTSQLWVYQSFFLLKKTKIISRHERFGDFPQLLCVLKRGIFCMLCSSQHFYLDYLVALEGELYQESNKPMHQCKKGTGRCKEEVSLFLASSSPSFTFSM